ncbi:isopentenyl-diphosphate Delta-isomerase [Corynebacterium camporealensis]|uniref:Isopentenyl-diphosphate Delta-isomerase n=1 Tax=Corynebacterium camporealensis TaxID=161896 RepID=A0A0F6TB69_9CORY|nr:isopentenyl-diphosphate Delta-isomerase [Corynebacterium camporealensis]AKE39666.1 isopentenyl-diphosphate delta-isomerase [Corynebacterium camporealensis]
MTELVVLADDQGKPAGTADKAKVHTADTPLHFAFSAWVRSGNKILLTRRALSKRTWPGVWTNAFCGHPGPGEATADTVIRRADFELNLDIPTPQLILPDFSYRAVDSSGIVEYEICPVYLVDLDASVAENASNGSADRLNLSPNPDEVDSYAWVDAEELITAADATPFAFSPWLVEELSHSELREALRK